MFACCGYAHSAIEATLELLGRMQKKKEEIAEIVVETAPGGQALRTVEPETVKVVPSSPKTLWPPPAEDEIKLFLLRVEFDTLNAVAPAAR